MIWFAREVIHRTLSFFKKKQRDADFEAEIASHIEQATADNLERGMSPEEARRQALIRLGGVEQAKEMHRDSRGLPLLETVLGDLRLAFRTLRRDAGLTTFAVLIVGLGVAASTTVFSVATALLLRPLPFEAPDRLVWIANGTSTNLSSQTVQVGNLLDLRERTQTLSDIAGYYAFYGAGDIRLGGAGEPLRLTGVPVTENFFRLLGVEPYLGQTFSPEAARDEASGVVLSYRLWQRHFDSSHDAIGSRVSLDGTPATVVGVLPDSFDFSATFTPGKRADLFTLYPLSPENDRNGNTLALIGRLTPGVGLPAAQAETTRLAEEIAAEQPEHTGTDAHAHNRNELHPNLSTLRDRVSGDVRQTVLILVGAVALLMLIVCANLSNLLLTRAQKRQREMAVRVALGAGRRRLVRLLLIESVVLSASGAALGFLLATGGTALLAQIEGTNIPLLNDVRVDPVALSFTLVLTLMTGLLFGLMPALRASAAAPAHALRESGRSATAGRGSSWLRSSLVVCEIALTCVLLTAVGLLLRSLVEVLDVDLGFESENIVALRVDPGGEGFGNDQTLAYFDDLLRTVRSVPGVESLGLTDALPLGDNFGWRTWDASAVGDEEIIHPLVRLIDEGYLQTLEVSVRAGRGFTRGDNATSDRVAIVNRALAERLWPGASAVGQSLVTSGHEHRVVGVVDEARYFALDRESGPELYLPIRQIRYYNSVDLVVQATGSPAALVPSLRQALRAVDPNLPTTDFRTMQQLVDKSTFSRRAVVMLLSGFATFGLILASLGVYAVISYSVAQRRKEMGVRMAFGATHGNLQRSVMRQTIGPALLGLGIGTAASWFVGQILRSLLYGVSAADPMTYVAALSLLAGATALASYVPARRTSKLDVVEALRAD